MKPMSMWFVLTCMVNFVNLFEAHAADNVFNNNGSLSLTKTHFQSSTKFESKDQSGKLTNFNCSNLVKINQIRSNSKYLSQNVTFDQVWPWLDRLWPRLVKISSSTIKVNIVPTHTNIYIYIYIYTWISDVKKDNVTKIRK